MREIRLSGSEGGGPNPIASPYSYNDLTRFAGFRAPITVTLAVMAPWGVASPHGQRRKIACSPELGPPV